MASDDRVHGNSDQKKLESGNIFVDISFNTRQNRMEFEAHNFTSVYAFACKMNAFKITLLTSL